MTVVSPAKINLVLRILDRRPDGYHNLWSLMQTVALHDRLTLTLDPTTDAIQLTCTNPDVPLGDANLIHRAVVAVRERAGLATGVRIHLDKHIPMGAGLGGGSSNAAATALGLVRLLGLSWSADQLTDATQQLGSDVPFFYRAPTAVVEGRGERVRAVSLAETRWILLVNPGFGVETAWAYKQLAASRTRPPSLPTECAAMAGQARMDWSQLTACMANDFEAIVFPQHELLRGIKTQLHAAGAESAWLSGTGATVFGIFRERATADAAQQRFASDARWRTWVVQTETAGLQIVAGS
ncbi:MAG: 4-(cytidine 5'-diphospho)-2-C-methyl-D-erythritol kinase [Nitrospiraceae bacterium]